MAAAAGTGKREEEESRHWNSGKKIINLGIRHVRMYVCLLSPFLVFSELCKMAFLSTRCKF